MTTKTDKHEYLRKAHQAANDFKYGYVTISNSDLGSLLAERDALCEATGQPVNGFYDPGMSLRDYFAAKAMAAMVASPDYVEGEWFQEDIALQAYTMADAMLEARDAE